MTYRVVPTVFGDVRTHRYSTFFDMLGPLGVETYALAFSYNERMSRWVCSARDGQDRPVFTGAPVLHLVNLLASAAPELRPRGFLVCQWTHAADAAEEPSELNLGSLCELIYFERIEDLDPTEFKILEAL